MCRGVFLPGRLPGKHRRASSGSSARPHPRDRLTGRPYPDPSRSCAPRGGRTAGRGKKCRRPAPASSHRPQFPRVRGRVFATSRRPPPGGLPVPPGGTLAGVGGVGVPGPSGWAPAKLRRREMESQHSPWAWGPAGGDGVPEGPLLARTLRDALDSDRSQPGAPTTERS